jgi:hypothetical protein
MIQQKNIVSFISKKEYKEIIKTKLYQKIKKGEN